MCAILTRTITILTLFFISYFATLAWSQNPSTAKPQNEEADKEYKELLKEYYAVTKEYDQAEEKAKKKDPTLARTIQWKEVEKNNFEGGDFRPMSETFAASLSKEKRKLYSIWLKGKEAAIRQQAFEEEWNKYPSSHKALLLCAQSLLGNERRRPGYDEKTSLAIPELSGNEEHQWKQFLNYIKKRDSEIITKSSQLEKELGIPEELIHTLNLRIHKGLGHLAYENIYYPGFFPEELRAIQKKRSRITSELNALDPDWAFKEKIRFRNEAEFRAYPKESESLSKWRPSMILIILGVILIFFAVFRIYRRRSCHATSK